jgi:hypothetical protein
MCKYEEIVVSFNSKKITSEIRELANFGLIDYQGKKGVASLSSDGVSYIRGVYNL